MALTIHTREYIPSLYNKITGVKSHIAEIFTYTVS